MRINLTSVLVDDQSTLRFTDVSGSRRRPRSQWVSTRGSRWCRPNPDGTELVLELAITLPCRRSRPRSCTTGSRSRRAVDDVASEHERLVALGVRFTQPPTEMGPVTTAVFDDTCGNLIQIAAQT
jgi:hypothetical protein